MACSTGPPGAACVMTKLINNMPNKNDPSKVNITKEFKKYKIISLDNYSSGQAVNHLKNSNIKYLRGNTKDTSIILKKYKNIAGKTLTIIGEYHSNVNKIMPNKVLNLLDKSNTVVFLEKYYNNDTQTITLLDKSLYQLRNAYVKNPRKNFLKKECTTLLMAQRGKHITKKIQMRKRKV